MDEKNDFGYDNFDYLDNKAQEIHIDKIHNCLNSYKFDLEEISLKKIAFLVNNNLGNGYLDQNFLDRIHLEEF